MRIACDIETNGLLHELDRIHSLVARDADTGDLIISCTDHPTGRAMGYRPISEGLEILSTARTLYFHNGIGFDIPALKKVYPDWSYQGDLLDTLITAQFRWAHLRDDPQEWARVRAGRMPARFVGQHSLAAWGYRLGVLKGTYGETTDWSEWTPAMQEYCERDTEVTVALVQHIRRSGGITPLALEIEHELAWYLEQQERNGWPFDEEKAQRLLALLSARREELGEELKEHFGWWYAPNGEINPKRSMRRKNPHTPGVREQYIEGARYTKLKREEFNPGSRDHIARRLIAVYGWEPTVFTDTGKPQVSETVLQGLKYPITDTLIEYLTVSKRLGQLSEGKEAWLRHSTRDGEEGGRLTGIPHIHGRVKQNHAVTHRAAHSNPNIAQVPKVSVPFGAECRELFTVPEGWVQVGADASGLELRCLAHYMARYDGGEYAKVVTEGDVHSTNRDALGWRGVEGRERAKTWI